MQTQGLDVELLTIAEAAQRLGVSIDTIHRRLRRGQLSGQRQPTPQGFTWLVEIPVGARDSKNGAPPEAPPTAGGTQRLDQSVAMLPGQAQVKDKHNEEPHRLLQQAQ